MRCNLKLTATKFLLVYLLMDKTPIKVELIRKSFLHDNT